MPETFAPTVLQNDTGQKLNADYFNRLETNLETFDDRIAAVEVGGNTLVAVPYAATIIPNAAQGGLFRIIATGNLTLADPINGTDGQSLEVQVKASGANRVLTTAGGTTSIPVGNWWIGQLHFIAVDGLWALIAEAMVPAPSGSNSVTAIVDTGRVDIDTIAA